MVKAKVSGVPYEVELPDESIGSILNEFTIRVCKYIDRLEVKHAEDIANLEHEIRLVRARNERLERETSNPLS